MTMLPKTLNDVLSLTQTFHAKLAHRMERCADRNPSERAKLLLEYFAKHEKDLSQTLEVFQREADPKALETWFYEYTDRHATVHSDPDKMPLDTMDSNAIYEHVVKIHGEIVDLYEHCYGRAEGYTVKEIAKEVLDRERSEAKLISYEGARTQEM